MAGRFSVESVFKAVDRVTAPVSRMQRAVSRFTRKANRGFRSLNRTVKKFGRGLRTVARVGTVALLGLGLIMGNVIRTGAEFEQTLVNAAAKFPEGVRRGTQAFKDLETIARQTGATTEFTATQAAQGLNFLAMAGFNAKQSMAALPGVVDLATAAQVDLATASDIATDSLGAFGLATKDAVQLGTNLGRVNDVMAKTAVTANTNMELMMETIKDGAPVATATGASLETFLALTGDLANAGIKGSKAGTTLKNVFLKLAAPTNQVAKLFRKIGVRTKDANGDLLDVIDILGDLDKGLGNLGTAERAAALDLIFGKRAIAGVNVLLKTGAKELREYRRVLEGATGASGEMASMMRDTLMGSIRTALSAFESLKLTIFSLKNVAVRGIIDEVTQFIRTLDIAVQANKTLASEMIDGLLRAGLGVIGVFTQLVALFVIAKTATLTWSVATGTATAATWLFSTGMAFLNGLFGVDVAGKKLSTAATIAWTIGTHAATAAQWLLNAALSANPIGLIIIGIAAAIGLGILLIKNWKGIVSAIGGAVRKIKTLLSILFFPLKTLIGGLSSILGLAEKLGFAASGTSTEESTGGVQGAETGAGVISPQARIARNIEEKRETSTAEITIRDESGRADMTQKGKLSGVELILLETGSF